MCNPRRAVVYDSGKGKDRYTIFLCKNVLSTAGDKLVKIGTTKDIQPCSCLGKEIKIDQLPPAVRTAIARRTI
jgi:hypothetical protein